MNEYGCLRCGKRVWRQRRALAIRSICEAGEHKSVWIWRITFWPFR